MKELETFLVFGATGQTGHHFVSRVLNEGSKVRAVVRDPIKIGIKHEHLEVVQGDITDALDFDELLQGVDYVVNLVGNATLQEQVKINTEFTQNLIPAMRRQKVRRYLYQAGGFSKRPDQRIFLVAWLARKTFARGFNGQHQDNEAVMEYLVAEAEDIEWMVHRAAISSDGPSKGLLHRTRFIPAPAPFIDCAAYNYRLIKDPSAIHTCDISRY